MERKFPRSNTRIFPRMLRYESPYRKGPSMPKTINFKRPKRKEIIMNFITPKKREESVTF